MAFDEQYKKELVNDIVNEVDGCYDYKDFAADCVREVVSKWDDGQLASWFGRENMGEFECPVLDNIECYTGQCEHYKTQPDETGLPQYILEPMGWLQIKEGLPCLLARNYNIESEGNYGNRLAYDIRFFSGSMGCNKFFNCGNIGETYQSIIEYSRTESVGIIE